MVGTMEKVVETQMDPLAMVEREDGTTLPQMKIVEPMGKVDETKLVTLVEEVEAMYEMDEPLKMDEPPRRWLRLQDRWLRPQWRRLRASSFG